MRRVPKRERSLIIQTGQGRSRRSERVGGGNQPLHARARARRTRHTLDTHSTHVHSRHTRTLVHLRMQRCVLPLADKARPDRVRERTFIHLAADGARSCRLFRPPTTDTTAPSPNRARRTLCRAKFPSSPMAALRSTQACRYEGGHWRAAAAPPPPQPTFTFSLRHTHPPTPMPTFSLPPPLPSRSHSGDDGLGLCKAHRQERTGRQRCRGPPRRVLHLLGQHKPGPVAGAAPLSGPAAHDTCLAACCRPASRLTTSAVPLHTPPSSHFPSASSSPRPHRRTTPPRARAAPSSTSSCTTAVALG